MKEQNLNLLKYFHKHKFSELITDTFPVNISENSGANLTITGRGIYQHEDFDSNKPNYRYYLEINIPDVTGYSILTAIMLNPSNTFPDKKKGFDATVRNVIRIAKKCNYSKLIVLNISASINPNGNNFLETFDKNSKEEKFNQNFIKEYIKSDCFDLLIAWGNKENRDITMLKKEYLETIAQNSRIHCKAYDWNINKQCPYHPSQQTDNLKLKSFQTMKEKNPQHIIRYFLKNDCKLLPLKAESSRLILNVKGS